MLDSLILFLESLLPWSAAVGAIAVYHLLGAWIIHRDQVKRRIAANNAGGLCPHGRYFWNRAYCAGCRADLAREFDQVEVKLEVKKETSTPPAPVSSLAGLAVGALAAGVGSMLAGSLFGGASAAAARATPEEARPRPRPLRINLPSARLAGCQVGLSFNSNARISGSTHVMYVFADGQTSEVVFNVPASCYDWIHYSYGGSILKAIIIDNVDGFDRISVMANGSRLVSGSPEMLRELSNVPTL